MVQYPNHSYNFVTGLRVSCKHGFVFVSIFHFKVSLLNKFEARKKKSNLWTGIYSGFGDLKFKNES